MNKCAVLGLMVFLFACGSSADSKVPDDGLEPVVKAVDEADRCNGFVDGEVKILRVAQTLMCVNGGNAHATIELSEKDGGGEMVLDYELSPHTSHKFVMPFFAGLVLGDLYVRANGGEWRRICVR